MSIYKSPRGRAQVMALYDRALARLGAGIESRCVPTRFGRTHVLAAGPATARPVVIFQNGNVVSPASLSWYLPLAGQYRLYAADTPGHPGRSAETRIPPGDDSYGRWAADLLDGLGLAQAPLLGHSYGGGIILRAAATVPERITGAVLLMPCSLGLGPIGPMLTRVLLPMLAYQLWPSPRRLVRAVQPLFTDPVDELWADVVGAAYTHIRLERRFPRTPSPEELSGYKAPTLVVAGQNDIFFPARTVLPRAEALLPNVTGSFCLKGSGHIPSPGGVALIQRLIREFLGSL